jgi:two-component system alkaline phosphatase synthesis response regulator PhoP
MASTLFNFFHKIAARADEPESLGQSLGRRIEAGDFSIDTHQRKVTIRGHEINLTEAEFDLLLFLCRHRRKVVTPRTLLITRWSQREARQQDFLPVLLSLRKKLECEMPGQHYIRMEPWMLCRFEPSTS